MTHFSISASLLFYNVTLLNPNDFLIYEQTQVGVDVQVLASHELWVFQFIDVSLGGWLLEECWIEWMAKIDPNDIGKNVGKFYINFL